MMCQPKLLPFNKRSTPNSWTHVCLCVAKFLWQGVLTIDLKYMYSCPFLFLRVKSMMPQALDICELQYVASSILASVAIYSKAIENQVPKFINLPSNNVGFTSQMLFQFILSCQFFTFSTKKILLFISLGDLTRLWFLFC